MAEADTYPGGAAAAEAAISACVRRFYALANDDPLLAPIFARSIGDWEEHFGHMDAFWSRILLGTDRYRRDPFAPHHPLRLRDEHFDRWRDLFQQAARETLAEPLRDRALGAAGQLAHCWRGHMVAPEEAAEARRLRA